MLLTPKQKLVFRMTRRQGLPQRDVAKALRISEPAVSQLLTRAENRVRDLMKECGAGAECGMLDAILE